MADIYTMRKVLLQSSGTILYVVLVADGGEELKHVFDTHVHGREGKILVLDRRANEEWVKDLYIQRGSNVLGFVHGAFVAAENEASNLPAMIGRCEEWLRDFRDPSKWVD